MRGIRLAIRAEAPRGSEWGIRLRARWGFAGLAVLLATACSLLASCASGTTTSGTPASGSAPTATSSATTSTASGPASLADGRYLYVFPDGAMDVYAMDRGFALVAHQALPTGIGTRGVAADPQHHALFLSYGSDSGSGGKLLKYDLVTGRVLWTHAYAHGIDSFAITPDGATIYMPDGELTDDGKWYEVNASDGSETGRVIDTGAVAGDNGPHNTVVSLDGRYVYLGDRNYNDTSSGGNNFYQYDRVSGHLNVIGPFRSGIRPFTVNRANTLVYATLTGYLGFQVGDLSPSSPTGGRVVATVPITRPAGISCPNSGATTPSHGISLSPDETELYVLDFPCNEVHVFDVRGAHATAPVQVADIPVTSFSGQESPCAYDCLRDGWLLHSLAGDLVMVGDSGDVISTATRRRVATLDALHNSRELIEIDWRGGVPVATTTRTGLGRA